uniref:CS domain-containing protein n=1 Tax=Panagrolaimus sp. ES5 TaxID=591445 RepID=A0AC34F315_9BILA
MASSSAVVKLEYYQTDAKVVVTLFEKNLEEAKVNVMCEPKKLKVTAGERILLNTSLYGEVLSNEVIYSVKPRKVEITLKKKDKSHWDVLEDKQKDEEDAKQVSTDKWSNMIREVEKEEEESKDVNGLFQKIFANADDDAKRAMLKSYSESKGTGNGYKFFGLISVTSFFSVLSTNWLEIGRDYKTLLKKAQDRKDRIEKLKEVAPEKAVALEGNIKFDKAIRQATGEKVKDNIELLKKGIKRKEKLKQRTKKKWDQRKQNEKKEKAKKQVKRKMNIEKRKDTVKENKIKKARKRGRVVVKSS